MHFKSAAKVNSRQSFHFFLVSFARKKGETRENKDYKKVFEKRIIFLPKSVWAGIEIFFFKRSPQEFSEFPVALMNKGSYRGA